VYKVASDAGLCYNKGTKLLRRNDALTSFRQLTRSRLRRRAMNTLPLPVHDDNPNTKPCSKCKHNFPRTREYFYADKRSKDGLQSACKKCQVKDKKVYATEHKEEIKLYKDKYNFDHREQHKVYLKEHREEISEQRRIYYQEHSQHLREYSAQYREDHPEEVRQSNARYNEEHKDRRKLSKARYNATHREENIRYNTMYHAEHREEHRIARAKHHAEHHEESLRYGRQYRTEHRDEINEQTRQYRRTDRGRIMHRTHENNRRARKLLIGGTLTVEQIQEKLKAQHYRCYYARCGFAKFPKVNGRYIFHLEHTIPVSRTEAGPRHDINYVVLSCSACNFKKNNRLPHEFFEGGRLL